MAGHTAEVTVTITLLRRQWFSRAADWTRAPAGRAPRVPERQGRRGVQSQPPNGSERHHAPRKTTGMASSRGNGYHGLQPEKQLQVRTDEIQMVRGTEDTYPPRPMTGPSPHTPPSLPAGPSGSAAGCATPAPRGCGMVRGASAGRGGWDRFAGPSPGDPGRDRMGWGHSLSHSLS